MVLDPLAPSLVPPLEGMGSDQRQDIVSIERIFVFSQNSFGNAPNFWRGKKWKLKKKNGSKLVIVKSSFGIIFQSVFTPLKNAFTLVAETPMNDNS